MNLLRRTSQQLDADLARLRAAMGEPAELWQAREGDVITIPRHFAPRMTVVSLTFDDPDGGRMWLTWTADCGWGRQGYTPAARIGTISRGAAVSAGDLDDDALAGLRAALTEGTD